MLLVLLAGGVGGRLGPLTQRRAKPVVPFGGAYRLVDLPLSNALHSGVADVWVLEQYRPHGLADHLANGRPWDLDRTVGGLQVLHPHRGGEGGGWHEGTADALWRQRAFLREKDPDVLLVVSADHVVRTDYRDVVARHVDAGAAVTMATTEVDPAGANRFGVVEVGPDGVVRSYAYKPEHPSSGTVTTEVFAFRTRALIERLEDLADAPAGSADDPDDDRDREEVSGLADLGDHVLASFVEERAAAAWPQPGYWRDVGTVPSYWEGHRDLLGDEPRFALDDASWPIRTVAVHHPPARLARGAEVADALVSPGARVAGRVERCVVGAGAIVGAGAEVRDSVLLPGCRVEDGARVDGAIVGSGAVVGAGAHVGAPVEDGTLPDVVVVGDGAQVRRGATVHAGVELDAAG